MEVLREVYFVVKSSLTKLTDSVNAKLIEDTGWVLDGPVQVYLDNQQGMMYLQRMIKTESMIHKSTKVSAPNSAYLLQ